MTDTQKVIEEQINQAWARGTNWAMQGRGYALDSNADTQAEVLIELFRNIQEEAKIEERAMVMENLPKIITPTVEPAPNKLSQNQIFASGQINMLLRVTDLLASLDKPVTKKQ